MSSTLSLVFRFAILVASLSATANYAAPTAAAEPAATTSKAAYPLRTCVVSGGKLGGMGKPVTYVYRQADQPDRTVIFCCKSCIKKFEKDPARFLAKLHTTETPAQAETKKYPAP